MSTPDQPDTPALTRRQLREIRNTGSTPVIPPDAATSARAETPAPAEAPAEAEVSDRAETPAEAPAPAEEATAESEPPTEAPAPTAPAPVEPTELGVSPLTRRQARQQERIRTASVPVITPDIAAAHEVPPAVITSVPAPQTPAAAQHADADPIEAELVEDRPVDAGVPAPAEHDSVADVAASDDADRSSAQLGSIAAVLETSDGDAATELQRDDAASISDDTENDAVHVARVNPALGSDLLVGKMPAAALPASFDQLIARSASTTGSVATPNALILSQTPAAAPLVAPVTATGEVLITGTFDLPEGLGSIGHAPGAADGKDLDIALIDGELLPASSPTPIAASAAISTVGNSGEEIIRPPLPDKSNRLTLVLVITIGVLALAVASVLVFALTTGRI